MPYPHFAFIIKVMDSKALYNLSYGVFLLGTRADVDGKNKINACITNTCFQTANNPVRIAISVIKQNLTCQMIEKSGVFALSVLDNTCTFETIKRFGYQSGRDTDKFDAFEYQLDSHGCPYLISETASVLECKVLNQLDLGTHMLFVAEVTDAKITGKNPPLTYAFYQSDIKPKAADAKKESAAEKKIKGWRCKICGYEYEGPELPPDFECPICGHPAEDFEPIFE